MDNPKTITNPSKGLSGSAARRLYFYVSRQVLEMYVSTSVISFNSGKRGLFDVYHHCDLEPGPYTKMYRYLGDASKVTRENINVDGAEEVPSYSSGAFSMKHYIYSGGVKFMCILGEVNSMFLILVTGKKLQIR